MTACADTLLQNLNTPAVRDLAWACFSPPLILSDAACPAGLAVANCGLSLDPQRRNWLLQLDREPLSLLRHLENLRSRRLGLYFESLWHFFLEQDDRVDLLGHNVPVRDSGQTIGEFDCLYYCHERQRYVHLELAVKFYLGIPGRDHGQAHSTWDRWLGPGSRDRLDLKMERLIQHQTQLGRHPKARETLQGMGIDYLELEMEMKGRLFNHWRQALPPPYGYNSDLVLSNWTTEPVTDGNTVCVILDKRHWLAPVTPASSLTPADLKLQPAIRPQVVAILDRRGYELERFFLAPESWPDQCPQ